MILVRNVFRLKFGQARDAVAAWIACEMRKMIGATEAGP